MPEVTFVLPDGSARTCIVRHGESVLDAALDNGVPGILGQCGGGCTCATCHVYVTAADLKRLPPAHPDEAEILEYVWRPTPYSRLACQLRFDEGLTALTVQVPAEQA